MGNKKVNPRRRPATMADIKRASKRAQDKAMTYTAAIFLTVLYDKFGFSKDDIRRVWSEANDLSDSVTQGYVSLSDLLNVLEREYETRVWEEKS